MFHKIFKKLSIKYLIPILSLAISAILFYPFLNIKNHIINQGNVNIKDYAIVSYNPINPRISAIIALDDKDSYFVYTSNYERNGIFTFQDVSKSNTNSQKSDSQNTRVDNKSLEEVKDLVKNQKLNSSQEIPKNLQEINEEKRKPFECQRLLDFQNIGRKVDDFSFLKKDDSFSVFWYKLNQKGSGYEKNNVHYFDLRLDDQKNDTLIKLTLLTNKSPLDDINTQIVQITITDTNCKQVEVPTKPDGTFDFDEALKKV